MVSINTKACIIQSVLKAFSKLPFAVAQFIGMSLGFMLYLFPNPVKRVVKINIERCFPHKTLKEQRHLILKTLMQTGCSVTEYGAWWLWRPVKLAPLVKSVHGEEYIQAARSQGKGILILAPHLGAWEISQGYMPSRYSCAIMYRPLRITALEEFVKTARERGGGDLLPLTPSGMREAYAKLARGEIVGILPDQVPGKNSGVFTPFFAIPAWTMTFAVKIAQKTQAAVFLGYAERLGIGKGFAIHFMPVSPEIYNPDLEKAVAAMNADIQTCVEKIPEQYQWAYKRFKVQPEGKKKFYARA
jgi:KDO2-lipid IV(A) lauroyltransferase